jgi:primosomal replication protein N
LIAPAGGTATTNRCVVTARLVRQGRTRYTPAGLQVRELGFQFTGSVVEAGFERQLDFEFDAVAVGDVAGQLAAVALGTELALSGFFAPTSRRSKRMRLHVTEYARHSGD